MITITENMWTVSVYYCEPSSGWKPSASLSIFLETTIQDMPFEISILDFFFLCVSQGKQDLHLPMKAFLGVMLTGIIVNLKGQVCHYPFIDVPRASSLNSWSTTITSECSGQPCFYITASITCVGTNWLFEKTLRLCVMVCTRPAMWNV